MKAFIRKRLNEEINAREASSEIPALQTLVDGRRKVAFIGLPTNRALHFIKTHGLLTKKVPSNPHRAIIIYTPEGEKDAIELLNLAEKYDGYLSMYASDDDTRRIGQLLGYKASDIEAHINKKKLRR
jgi:hypothetical protein